MSVFKEVKANEFDKNLFKMIGEQWMLVAAQKEDRVNMMTASWGGTGILWRKAVVYVFIRPQRFTKEFVDGGETFSLNFFDESYRKQLVLCGEKSGRDIDKVKECGFEVSSDYGTPIFKEAEIAMVCQKLYRQPMGGEYFIGAGKEFDEMFYPEKDYHDLYVAEIKKILVK